MSFSPSRLVVARKRRRLTLSGLSDRSGVLVRSITAYENARTVPTESSLSALAQALDFPVAFFRLPEVDEIPLDSLSFRAMSKMTAGQREAARSSAAIATTIASWVNHRFDIPQVELPTLSHLSPEEASINLRGAWGLGEAPIPNLLHLVESRGIKVFSLAADCRDVDAFCTRAGGGPFVFLNLTKSGERGRFDLAHELGHLVMHGDSRIPHGPEAEQEAQRFASAFLMPRSDVLAEGLRLARPEQIVRAKRRRGVSAMALNYRLRDLGLTTEWQYNNSARALAQQGFRRGEPGGLPRESSQLWRKVIAELVRQGIGWSALSADLGLPREELSAHLFGLVPVTLAGEGTLTVNGARPTLRVVGHSGG